MSDVDLVDGSTTCPVIGVLISGRGSNLQAIIDAIDARRLQARIGIVIANVADAQGLQRAEAAGLRTAVVEHGRFPTRPAFERVVVDLLNAHGVELVCLAGFMRRVGSTLLDAFPSRILNIHPSLLPAFPGLHAQRQALAYGVRYTGATVHLVTAGLDEGPIVQQAVVPVQEDDTEARLSARILVEEHRIYPDAIARVLGAGWRLDGRRVVAVSSSV